MKFSLLLPALLLTQNVNTCNKHAPVITATKTSSTTTADTGFATAIQQIFYYTNLERQQAHLQPLTLNDKLTAVADNYVGLMVKENEFSHEINGQTLPMRFSAAGYTWRYIAENIAASSDLDGKTAVENEWMHSPGHRANILNKNYTEIGIGIAYSKKLNLYYYCQDFGQPR